jgi:nicotinamidase-related amidase
MSPITALPVVDLQYDFLPDGALAVPDGDQIVEPIAASSSTDRPPTRRCRRNPRVNL